MRSAMFLSRSSIRDPISSSKTEVKEINTSKELQDFYLFCKGSLSPTTTCELIKKTGVEGAG